MKSLLIFMLSIAILMGGCSQRPKEKPLDLGPYPPDLCSLIVRTQMAPIVEKREVWLSLREEVKSRLADDTSRHTCAVLIYTGVAPLRWKGLGLTWREMLDSALRMVDSVRYPVMAHRLKAEILKLEQPFTREIYFEIRDELDYFTQIKDTLSMAMLEVSLGPHFHDVGCTIEALEVTKKVMNTFESIGQTRLSSRTRINLALYYEATGDTARRDSVTRLLLDDEEIRRNSPEFREGLVRNTYISTEDTSYLNEGWSIVQSEPLLIRHATAYYALFGEREVAQGNPDSALMLVARGREIGERYGYPNESHRLLLLSTTAKAYDRKGIVDSAFKYYKQMVITKDSLDRLASGQEIMRISHGREMEALKFEQALQRSHDRWIWSIIVGIVIICALLIYAYIWRQRQKIQFHLLKQQGETERTRHKLAANMLARQEKDSLLSEMNRHISEMNSQGHLSSSAASELQNMIRLHESGQKEWEALEELLVKVRPRFMERLRERAPEISVKYCRLAAYIYIGMSSQQIANLLMISSKSVYQGRWRLRRQLNVPEGEGLEEFLERLAAE